jgi:GH25 family lysozyme M1 (1,4-beta-N-acetylmuramidase)
MIIDISSWQDPALINYSTISEQIDGVIIRIGIGMSKDYHFERHYQEFSSRNKPIGYYHVPVNDNPQGQANMVKTAISGKRNDLGVWADVEASYQSRAGVNAYVPIVENTLGFEIGFYSSKAKWAEIMQNETRWASRNLWVAAYGYSVPPLPPAWTEYALWQYSSTGRLAGYNDNLDMNRVGTLELEPEPEPEPDVVLFQARATAPANLRVRSGPSVTYPVSAPSIPLGTIVDVYETRSGWNRHNKGGWSDSTWLTPVEDDEPPVVIGEYYGPLYWQRDERWVRKPLGTSGTIGQWGCAVVSETNVLNQLGAVTNPMANNAWRTTHGGYHDGNLIVWKKVEEQFPSIIWEGRTYNPTDAQMIQKINQGCGLVILVDFNENTPALDQHWVNSIPSIDGAIWIHDPWTNETIRLRDKYHKPIQQFTSYRRRA